MRQEIIAAGIVGVLVGTFIGYGIGLPRTNNLKDQVSTLEDEVTTLEGENSDLEDQVSTLQDEKTELQDQVASLEEELAEPGQEITANQDPGGEVNWILPGRRELDPKIFGTPENPLGFEHDIGVPLDQRLTNEDGTEYTTTAFPTPHSDKHEQVSGSFNLNLVDKTPVDKPDSMDEAEAEFEFTGPQGDEYRVVLKKKIPVGPDHQIFGGVLVDGWLHGQTGFGTRLQPTQYTYGAFWGVAEFHVNGEMVSGNRLIHTMVTEDVRDENYELMIDEELPREGVTTHMILPNTVVTPDGPQTKPLPSNFMLPNGSEQPFIHIMFEDTNLDGLKVLE